MNPSHTRLPTSRRLLWLLVIALALTCPSRAPRRAPEPHPDRPARPARARGPAEPADTAGRDGGLPRCHPATATTPAPPSSSTSDGCPRPRALKTDPTLARQLRIVLDQALAPDPEALSDEEDSSRRDGLPPDRELVGTIKGKASSTPIVLQRVQGDGDTRLWKISAATVAQIPRLYREYGYGPLGDYLPPAFFEIRFLDLALWQWIGFLLLVAVSSALAWVGALVVLRGARPLVRRAAPVLGDRFLAALAGPLRLAVGLMIFCRGQRAARPLDPRAQRSSASSKRPSPSSSSRGSSFAPAT